MMSLAADSEQARALSVSAGSFHLNVVTDQQSVAGNSRVSWLPEIT